jgi:peptidyl-prolyl cis-trans isomerase A (cyclophilin A)
MIRLLLLLTLLATPAFAQVPAILPRVVLETGLGPIVVELEAEKAPATVANFLRYVREKRLDGTDFYRAMKLAPDGSLGLIQGGVRGDPKRSLPPVRHEPTSLTGLSHRHGTVSLARAAPGSATADFFIVVGDIPSLDANPAGAGDNQGFAAFGRVVEGMDVVRRILASPTSPTQGEGVMKGQMLQPAIPIRSIVRQP